MTSGDPARGAPGAARAAAGEDQCSITMATGHRTALMGFPAVPLATEIGVTVFD